MDRLVRNGKTLLSGVDPAGRGERLADSVSVKDRILYICPSPLYGHGLSRFISRLETQAPNSALLCIEADKELFCLAQKNIDSTVTENKKFHLTNICEGEKLYTLVRNTWGVRAFRRVETIRFTGGWQLFPELYDSLCEILNREIITDWSNALTLARLGRLYIRNALRNLTLVSQFPSIAGLSFGSSNVLVLGAGPSLDFTLDAVNRELPNDHKNRAFKIICVDTCLGALKDRGIVPDLAVILESQHWNLRAFTGINGWNIPAAIDLSSLPASAKKLGGNGCLFMTPWTHLRIFERLQTAGLLPAVLPPLGSVGLTAVKLARRLTTGKIICAGLDFSFTQDLYHARSTPGHRNKLNSKNRFRTILNLEECDKHSFAVLSKSGSFVRSNPIMINYRNLFEQEFAGNGQIFDIEGSGLPLGLKTLSMKEALALLDQKEFGRKPNNRTNHYKNIAAHVFDLDEVRSKNKKLKSFYEGELNRLEELRDMLSGETASDALRLGALIEECDYLWAHFPDYAGGRSHDLTDISFLKRVRTEIDPMFALIKRQQKAILHQ